MTIRNTADLLELAADNSVGAISCADLRDVIQSAFNRLDDDLVAIDGNGDATITGTLTAAAFSGDGSDVTGLNLAGHNVSELSNDVGYITDISGQNLSTANNDAGFLTSENNPNVPDYSPGTSGNYVLNDDIGTVTWQAANYLTEDTNPNVPDYQTNTQGSYVLNEDPTGIRSWEQLNLNGAYSSSTGMLYADNHVVHTDASFTTDGAGNITCVSISGYGNGLTGVTASAILTTVTTVDNVGMMYGDGGAPSTVHTDTAIRSNGTGELTIGITGTAGVINVSNDTPTNTVILDGQTGSIYGNTLNVNSSATVGNTIGNSGTLTLTNGMGTFITLNGSTGNVSATSLTLNSGNLDMNSGDIVNADSITAATFSGDGNSLTNLNITGHNVSELNNDTGYISDISGQNLSTADNSTSMFTTRGVPEIDGMGANNQQFLQATGSIYAWASISQVPFVDGAGANDGQVLQADGGGSYAWASILQVPSADAAGANNGHALLADAIGDYAWSAISQVPGVDGTGANLDQVLVADGTGGYAWAGIPAHTHTMGDITDSTWISDISGQNLSSANNDSNWISGLETTVTTVDGVGMMYGDGTTLQTDPRLTCDGNGTISIHDDASAIRITLQCIGAEGKIDADTLTATELNVTNINVPDAGCIYFNGGPADAIVCGGNRITTCLDIQTDSVTLSNGSITSVGVAVADATDTSDVVAQFNALLASLRATGMLNT